MSQTSKPSYRSNADVPDREGLSIRSLAVARVFEQLDETQKLYAHYLSKASWAGYRIILEQVSPEATTIFDLILELHQSCQGKWETLLASNSPSPDDLLHLERFTIYAALVLFNMGNYYGYGDKKFVPGIPSEFIISLAQKSSLKAQQLLNRCIGPMLSSKPSTLGFPGEHTQSGYYPSDKAITKEEVKAVDKLLDSQKIGSENTRVIKISPEEKNAEFEVLQASADMSDPHSIGNIDSGALVNLRKGDHAASLKLVSEYLLAAKEYAENDNQKAFLTELINHFSNGDIEHFKKAQALWLKDHDPVVESAIGFIEAYRDPAGVRAEFEGIVALRDKAASVKLSELVENSQKYIASLPWVSYFEDTDGLGPLEREKFEVPDFTAVHALAYCSSIIFLGINLPNYEDIREQIGFKNVMVANRNSPPDLTIVDAAKEAPFVDPSESVAYLAHQNSAWDLHISLHELFGHGTGNRLLKEEDTGTFNFDVKQPPINPLTHKPVNSWYTKDQTVPSVFGDLNQTLSECRADCIGLYMITDREILSSFGFDGGSELKADDIIYTSYLHAAVLGLQALRSYDSEQKKWGQAHERGFFAILQTFLKEEGFVELTVDHETKNVIIKIDRAKVISHGKRAVGQLSLQLHMWRCTGDYQTAKEQYEALTAVNEEWERIRSILQGKDSKAWIFIQANTFLRENGSVELKEYEETPTGVLQSWIERIPTNYYVTSFDNHPKS